MFCFILGLEMLIRSDSISITVFLEFQHLAQPLLNSAVLILCDNHIENTGEEISKQLRKRKHRSNTRTSTSERFRQFALFFVTRVRDIINNHQAYPHTLRVENITLLFPNFARKVYSDFRIAEG
jgi:hypothetical protein